MNVLFGSLSPTRGCAGDGAAFIAEAHGIRADERVAANGLEAWAASDSGVLVGHAGQDDVHLLFLGTLHHPLPEWRGGAPVDDPSVSADYLLDRFRRLDVKFLDGIPGQYAVVVCIPSQRRLLLASDPLGHRTLYCFHSGASDRRVFSTNLRVLAAMLGPSLEVDRSMEDFFLMHGFFPWGRTTYKGVTALDKGTILEWHEETTRRHTIEFANPWRGRFDAQTAAGAPESDVVEALYEGFMLALREQLTSEQRVGVLLGGFDSALVAAALHRLGKSVETFSFYYDDQRYNQPHVDTLQRALGHQHHWVKLTREKLAHGLRNFSTYFNQPTNWPNYVIQTADVCEQMRALGIRFCYTGDGCDSVFMGYPGTYRRAVAFENIPTLPRSASALLIKLLARPLLDRRLGHPYRVGLNMVRALGREMPTRGYLSFRIMDEVSIDQLRQGDRPEQELTPDDLGRQLSAPHRGLPGLRLAYLGKAAVSPNRNKMVGSSDRSGIALLSPYMHPGMKQLSLSLPEELCRPNQDTPSKVTGKYILMRMAEQKQLLPREVIYQPKVAAVDGPIDAWYAGPLRAVMLELMEGLPFAYSRRYVNSLLNQKLSESLFKRYVMTDKVISHAASLAATYASFTGLAPTTAARDRC
jgi:asparagine synthetase B (glutamine-hydrolysing)